MRVSELWAKVLEMIAEGLDGTAAFRKIRQLGGRDITKDDEEFKGIYSRLAKQPLFARHMVLTLTRKEFQEDVVRAVLETAPPEGHAAIDERMAAIREFEGGSFEGLSTCLGYLADSSELETRGRALWPDIFNRMDAMNAANAARDAKPDAESTVSPEPVEQAAVPVVPA